MEPTHSSWQNLLFSFLVPLSTEKGWLAGCCVSLVSKEDEAMALPRGQTSRRTANLGSSSAPEPQTLNCHHAEP